MRPTKAILLAAGFGTRMRPLSFDLPKPMMPLWGKPALDHMIDLLRGWGVREVLINLHHQPGSIVEHFRGHAGMRVCFSFEPDLLGTGGALRRAAWFLDEQPFWVVNTDIAADLDAAPLRHTFSRRRAIAALWMHPERGPRTVELRDGLVRDFRSRRAGAPGTATFCGLQLISPRLLDFVPASGFSTLVDAYEAAGRAGERVAGVVVPHAFWADLGDPSAYRATHAEVARRAAEGSPGGRLMDPHCVQSPGALRRRGVHVEGFAAVDRTAIVEPGAVIRNSVVWPHARIAREARLEHAIVGRSTVAHGQTGEWALNTSFLRDDAIVARALDLLSWPPADVTFIPFAARGSDRMFARLCRKTDTAILIHYGRQRRENARYASHARFLSSQGVPVPTVLAHDTKRAITLMEDWGDRSLQDEAAKADEPTLERLYRRVLEALMDMHAITPEAIRSAGIHLERPFSPTLYRWERELMRKYLLIDHLHLDTATIDAVMSDLTAVERRLRPSPRALVHRDMQSSNVVLKNRQLALIDFQGMRWGAAAYDLASLLCDPYVMLPERLQENLLTFYERRSPRGALVRQAFWPAAIQRLAQALGAYGRLSALPGTARFADYIPPALHMMARALNHVEGLDHLRALLSKTIDPGR